VLPVLDSPAAALAVDAVQIHANFPNLCCDQPLIKGNAKEALRNSAAVVEARFNTQINHMAPLEAEQAWLSGKTRTRARMPSWSSSDAALISMVIWPCCRRPSAWENMSYIEAYAGGQFGIKADITTEGITAAAAVHFKRAVRYIPSLAESMLMTTKSHAIQMDVKLGQTPRAS